MPHINRIRVNNVKYNFGTQFYDDFIMRFSGKNTIYDLANGGGKSVLMLLLLQNMIPNCTLDDKQPIEKLFRTGNGSNTIHSLVEWKLSDVHIQNNYRYMLTGFCARKARDEDKSNEESASIDYFNYVIFYREYNDNDIKNLPLSVPSAKDPKVKERITYNGLKNYLRDLEKKDFSLEVRIFEKKGDYQRFISQYGIYESEWEIIRGINKTEGHVRTYFESNYKTTRKVVEDLLIEEIIEKSFKNRIMSSEKAKNHENHMVETLIDIKDKLLELSARKDDIQNYDRQMELLENFVERISGIKKLYFGQENLEKEMAAGYHSLKEILRSDEGRKEAVEQLLAELEEQVLAEQKGIDTVKVQENEKKVQLLNVELEKLKAQDESLEKENAVLQHSLLLAESMNDYLDYLYYKKERDMVRESIERISADKSELMEELKQLASEKKKRDEKLYLDIHEKLEEEEVRSRKDEDTLEELKSQQEDLVREITIAEYQIKEHENRVNEYNQKIAELKHSVNLLMVYDLNREKALCLEQIEKNQQDLEENRDRIDKNEEDAKNAEEKIQITQNLLDELEQKLEDNIDHRMSLAEQRERIEKLKAVYHENSADELKCHLEQKQKEALAECRIKEEERRKTLRYISGLKAGCPVGDTQDIQKVLEYINRFHVGKAIPGSEIMRNATPDQRRELISQAPLLPYSVVVLEQFERVAGDAGLEELELGDCVVPVISKKALDQGEYFYSDDIAYAMCRKELFYDEKVQSVELAKSENIVIEIENTISRLTDNINEYEKDREFVEEFLEKYRDAMENEEEEYNSMKLQLKEQTTILNQTRELYEKNKSDRIVLEKEMQCLRDEEEKLQERKLAIEMIIDDTETAKRSEEVLYQAQDTRKAAAKELVNVQGRIEAWKAREQANQKKIETLKKREEEVRAHWEHYRRYYKEDEKENISIYADLTDEEIEAKFRGAADAFENGNTHIADKQKLLDNYEVAMDKSLQAIDYKGVSVEDISRRYEEEGSHETTKQELLDYKKKMEHKSGEMKEIRAESARIRSERDKLEGAVTNGKEAIIQKYGSFANVDFGNRSVDDYVAEKQQVIDELNRRSGEVRQNAKAMEEERKQYEILLHDMDKVVTEEMLQKYPEERFEVRENLCERAENSLKAYENFKEDIEKRKDEFEEEKNQMLQTFRLMKAAPLADEIYANAEMPGSVMETENLMTGLRDIIHCLQLEKERISKSIMDMEMIKENFESQCIQSCINIRTELEKLPKLSRIVMDGESIPIISLHIPYVKEEEYQERMSAYINEIVEQADTIKSESERIRYVKNQLSWKHLFAVIVTDMNSIRLNLYKRERMKEQSRYLRYEEAVGSTGQSQGIYIQFLIAVINYISSINSHDTDSTSLLKVIFIDNPFGAAKDIYIWEPIFKMLKTNNVQLVVPCRGATPAITGRFDVNYVLGQKLVDGRQQTVVVDYFSNVDSDKLDYTTMTYEQGSLDFLP